MANVSIITACKNREENLLKVIDTWLSIECEEVIVVDWSCDIPLFETFHQAGLKDRRIKLIRVEDESRWILTHAYNVGLKRCNSSLVLKLDNDHSISRDFLEINYMSSEIDARIGSWRLVSDPSQHYINGAFFAKNNALRDIGYFNEMITTYGWDDSYLHESLFSHGAKISYLDPETIKHIDQEEITRTAQQAVSYEELISASVGKSVTEFMNRRNMYLTSLLPRQSSTVTQSQYEQLSSKVEYGLNTTTLRRLSNISRDLDDSYTRLANLLAYRDFYSWANGVDPYTFNISEIHQLHDKLDSLDHNCASIESQSTDISNSRHTHNKNHKNKVSFVPQKLQSHLWKLLPLACSYYGHTSNDACYQIDISSLNLDLSSEQALNDLLPSWVCKKVTFTQNDSSLNLEANLVKPWLQADSFIEKVLFNTEQNKYFWAAINSLNPCLKRSVYELVEKGGKPIDLILSTSIKQFKAAKINKQQLIKRLKPLDLIFPSQSLIEFESWVNQKVNHISSSVGEEIGNMVYEILLDSPRINQTSLTLTTSLFKGSKHMIGYALNIRRMHLFERTEVVVSIAPSSESASQYKYLVDHFYDAPNVKVILMDEDPGLYQSWNNTIQASSSKYASNANIDDRRSRYHSDYLIYMMEYMDLDVAASALMADITDTSTCFSETQDIWFLGMGKIIQANDLILEKENSVTSQNLLHCMPIWKVSLHNEIGFFDEEIFGTSADWEFWLRALEKSKRLYLLDIPLGFYLIDSRSHNRRDLESRRTSEKNILNKHFPDRILSKNIELN